MYWTMAGVDSSPDEKGGSRGRTGAFPPRFLNIILTVSHFVFPAQLSRGRGTRMTEEKTTRELGLTRRART